VLPALEAVETARFDLPDPSEVGDHRSCRLDLTECPVAPLRDVGGRSRAGHQRAAGARAAKARSTSFERSIAAKQSAG